MNDLNLIWQTKAGEQTEFEFEYTTEVLFKKIKSNYIFDNGSFKTIKDNSVIIYSNDSKNASPEFIHYLNKFVKRRFRFYLLHFSNERLNHDCWYYSKANYVFRNYFHPAIETTNVLFIPLGFKSGYLNKENAINDCKDKQIDIAFIGQPKADRFEMISEMEKLNSYYLHKTSKWNCTTSLSQSQAIEIYKKTKYIPCPMGNIHTDSFRVCESLEWGCIPVVKTINGEDYFKNIFGSHPFKIINDWSEIADVVNEPDYCEQRAAVHQWYMHFKEDLQIRIEGIIESGGLKGYHPVNTFKDLRFEALRIYGKVKALIKLLLKRK